MRKNLVLGLAAGCLLAMLALLVFNYLGDEFGAGRVLRRAIGAQGGAEAIRNIKAGRLKGHGIRHDGLYGPAPFEWEEAFQYPDRYKLVIRPKAGYEIIYLAPAKQWWLREAGGPPQLKSDLREVQPTSKLEPLRQLLAVQTQKMPMILLEDDEVTFRPAFALQAQSEEWGQVVFSIDKARGLLLRVRGQLDLKDQEPVKIERVYSRHQEIHGMVVPMKVVNHVNGRLESESTITDVEFVDQLDSALFAAP